MAELPRYAVLFKAHAWDAFIDRQFRRLQEKVPPGDLFIILDETRGPIGGIEYPRILRMTEQMSEDDGYLAEPRGNLFWYNTDYQLYHFIDRYPSYDYVVTVEYDCVVNIPLSGIVAAMSEHRVGFVGERIRSPASDWGWLKLVKPYYSPDTEIVGRLLCFAAFSRDFARQLQAARREHTRRALAGEIPAVEPESIPWPNNEGFVGAEIARLKARELPLSTFGNVSHYDWAPPYAESDLFRFRESAVLHPVLDGPRHIRSLLKIQWNIDDLFQKDSYVRSHFEQFDPDHAVATLLRYFAETRNWQSLSRLHQYAEERVGDRARALFNVARGKPATQSSVSPWSNWPDRAQDAAGAVNGRITGGYGFHTHLEKMPWWSVDLGTLYPVTEIRIHNRLDIPSRARRLVVNASVDMINWQPLYQHEDDQDFGGADGAPLVIQPEFPVPLRFLRLHLDARELLHLDEVEVFV